MRHLHSTITPGVVHVRAREAIGGVLDWKPFGELVAVTDLLDLLLMMAATATSLFAVVERFFGFCHQTARDAIQANLPGLDRLVQGLLDALHETAQFSRLDRRRSWLLAIDTHYVPYYGKPNAYVVGGPKKQGTKWFFAYATAVLLHKGRRYTIALCSLLPRTKPHEIVRTLLQQIADKGLKIRGVVLDSAFDSGETFLLLQERHLAYTVPLRRKGGNKRNARNRLFEGRNKQVRWVEWNVKDTPRQVRTRAVLCKGGPRTMLLAFQGWNQTRAHNVHQEARRQKRLYQRRFGIETSYRQKNQAKATTTSSDPVYRLLLEGVGYLLRQIWVVLTAQLRQGHPNSAWIGSLPMHRLLDWLLHELNTLHGEEFAIPTSTTSYETKVA